MLRKAVLAAAAFLLTMSAAAAQSNCPYIATGAVLTAAQWNQCFASKQNAILYTTVNKAGDTMTGALVTSASNTTRAGLNIPPGTAPTSPVNGDVWSTSAGLFVQAGGVTYGPIFGTPTGLAHSVLGVAGNAAATVASIQGTADQILRITGAGTGAGFGSIDLSKAAAVGTSVLRTVNGGLGLDASGSTGVPLFSAGTAAFQATMGTGNIARADGSTFTNGNFTGAATITSGSITGMPTPTNASDVATMGYVQSFSGRGQGIATQWATAAALPNTPTYSNGTLGVGATLTAGANAAIVVDGGSPALNARVLVKNQAAPAQNGVFSVTTVGDGSTPWVLTRVTDFDEAAEMAAGVGFLVLGGATNINTGWGLAATVATVGTSAVTFNQSSSSIGTLLAANNLSDLSSAATARANLGLLSMATQAASSVAITGGALNGTLGATTPTTVAGTTGTFSGALRAGNGTTSGEFLILQAASGTGQGALAGWHNSSNTLLGVVGQYAGWISSGTSEATVLAAQGNRDVVLATNGTDRLRIDGAGVVTFSGKTCSSAGGLASLSSAGVFDCSDFVQTGSGASARQWQAKVGETVSIADFGGSTGASGATNTTALSNAAAVNGFTAIPAGDFTTNTNFIGGASLGQVYGPGTLVDSAGHRRGRWLVNFNSSLTGWAIPTDPATWYNADTSKMAIAVESIVTVPPVPRPTGTVRTQALAGASTIELNTVPASMGFAANTAAALYVSNSTSPASINFGTFITAISAGTPGTITLSAPLAANANVNDTILFGYGQYTAQAEASTIAAYVSTAADTLNVGQTNTGSDISNSRVSGQYLSQFRCQFFNGAAGGGGNCYDGTVTVNAAYPSYNQSNPANTVNVGMYAGAIVVKADNPWLDPFDVGIIDNGHPLTLNNFQANLTRTIAKTYDAQRWTGFNANLGTSSALAADAIVRGSGWTFYGLDFTNVLIPSGGPIGGRPAIALAEGHGIAFNTTGTVNGATNAGLSFIQRDTSSHNLLLTNANSGVSGMEISTVNTVYFPSATQAGPRVVMGAGAGGSGGILQVGAGLLASSNTNIGVPFYPAINSGMQFQAQTTDPGNALYFNNSSGTNVGSIAMTTTATSFNTSSDIRLKRDFELIAEAGDILDALKPGKFRWRSDGRVGFGVPAQQAFEVFPAAVTKGDDDPDVVTTAWSVDYSKFVPLLMADHQDLRRRVLAIEKALNAR